MDKIFSGDYLFQTPSVTPSGFFAALTVGFVVLLLVSAFVYWRRGKLARENPVLRRLLRRIAKAGAWLALTGLFLAAMRYLQIPYLGMRMWMYLLLLSVIATAAYFVYDVSERYPAAVHRLQESQEGRRYRPAGKTRRAPQRVRPAVRGKRRR